MENLLQLKLTRFRAYQLGSKGSSFSYFDGSHFTFIEARLTDQSRPCLEAELKTCGVSTINCLHITSWDTDHCSKADLEEIIETWAPSKIEHPGYTPHSDTGKECLKIINAYKKRPKKKVIKVDPPYIDSLDSSSNWGYRNIMYWPRQIDAETANNNSSVKLLRTGCFNVLSLGDLEDVKIANYLKGQKTLQSETDIMILAHHGADNGFTTKAFLKRLKPKVAICSSPFGSQFDHPRQPIRDLLHELEIPIYTTKTGDVVITSINNHSKHYKIHNLKANSTELSSSKVLTSTKSGYLKNKDSAQKHYQGSRNSFSKFF